MHTERPLSQPQPNPWNYVYPPAAQAGVPGLSSMDLQAWQQRLQQAELKMKELTDQLGNIQKKLDELSSKPPLHVEYHFDQLKVNRLEGTLNVGLSPQGMPGIESFEAPDPSCFQVNAQEQESVPISDLQDDMAKEMDTRYPSLLIELERQMQVDLNADDRLRVLADVKRQLNDRVHYYARTIEFPAKGTEEEQRQWRESIKEKTRRDIQGAFSAYLSKQRQKQNGGNKNP